MQQEPATPHRDSLLIRLRDWYIDPQTKPWQVWMFAGFTALMTAMAVTKPSTGRTWEAAITAVGTLLAWNNLRRGR